MKAGNDGGFNGDAAGGGDGVLVHGRRRLTKEVLMAKAVATTDLPLGDGNEVVMVGNDGGFDGNDNDSDDGGLVLGRRQRGRDGRRRRRILTVLGSGDDGLFLG